MMQVTSTTFRAYELYEELMSSINCPFCGLKYCIQAPRRNWSSYKSTEECPECNTYFNVSFKK